MSHVDVVEVQYNPDLVLVLEALGIAWRVGHQPNGTSGTILVHYTQDIDGRLESAIGSLADLRWRYEPGRTLQLAFDLESGGAG